MKITLYAAISIDGYIAKPDGDSDWVSEVDEEHFDKEINETDCLVVGRKTFDQYREELYPVKDVLNIILTKDSTRKARHDNVIFVSTPRECIEMAGEKGGKSILLVGGGHTNGAFFKKDLIDEIILSIHPLSLGKGIRLFEGVSSTIRLRRIGVTELDEGLVQVRYRVKK